MVHSTPLGIRKHSSQLASLIEVHVIIPEQYVRFIPSTNEALNDTIAQMKVPSDSITSSDII